MIHVTMIEVAINPAVLKTREGLQWLIGYNREALNDGNERLANKTDIMTVMCELFHDLPPRANIHTEWYELDRIYGLLPF